MALQMALQMAGQTALLWVDQMVSLWADLWVHQTVGLKARCWVDEKVLQSVDQKELLVHLSVGLLEAEKLVGLWALQLET